MTQFNFSGKDTVRTMRLHETRKIALHDEPMPPVGSDETAVRVTVVGICGSDLHWYETGGIGDIKLTKPLVLGHEFAGVTAGGQRVAVDPCVPCEQCKDCLNGNPNLCSLQHFAGSTLDDGGFREWVVWKTRSLVPLPDSLSDEDGAMLEPLGIAIHAVDLGHVRVGMRVGVFGCGPIGLLVVHVARAAGAAEIHVTEPLPHRLDAAKQWGAREWDGKQEVDVAFECAGVGAALDDAVNAATNGGRVVIVGIADADRTSFPAGPARRKGLTIKISRRAKHTYPRAIRMVENGLVDVRSLITHRFPLDQIQAAFDVAQQRRGHKVMVLP
jgi:L-iditol 2-dehydrogenase